MNLYQMLFAAGAGATILFLLWLASGRSDALHRTESSGGKWQVAAALSAAYLGYSLIPITREGPLGFVANHVANHWGVQVFWDLCIALCAALFLVAPRARRAGMNFALWLIPVATLGSIGLLALLARLFWLEQRQAEQA